MASLNSTRIPQMRVFTRLGSNTTLLTIGIDEDHTVQLARNVDQEEEGVESRVATTRARALFYNSARIRKALDFMKGACQKMRPFYRSRFFVFTPLKTGEISTGTQTWSLSLNSSLRHPWGPVELSLRCSSAHLPVTAKLQYKVGSQSQDGHEVWVLIDAPVVEKRVVHLMSDIREMRLTVYTESQSFELRSLQMREIGKSQRAFSKAIALLSWALRNPGTVRTKAQRAVAMYKKGGLRAIQERLIRSDRYPEWVQMRDTITERDRQEMAEYIKTLSYQPQISILLPVYNVPESYLRAAIESVRSQIYQNWQLCIADDNSPSAHIKRVIQEYAALDPRITSVFRDQNGHIAEATNSAAKLATGEFIGFLDHDDELREHALYWMVRELHEHPNADLIYSDEDKITEEGVRHYPHFKSDWNPELILSQNYVCHFTVVRRALFEKLGGIRKGFDGAQDWDFVLRVSENTTPDNIRHIPKILYHWRVIDGSTAKETEAKPYVTAAQIKAVSEHLERIGDRKARVEALPGLSMLRVRFQLPEQNPLVSVIIPTYNQWELLSVCIEGLLHQTNYHNLEIIVVDNRSDDPATLDYLQRVASDARVSVLRDDGEFNFSRINNQAASYAKGELICFLNNDIQISNPEWLREMVSNVVRPGVGIVGARLLYPDGTLQHAGVILGIGGVADHMFKHQSAQYVGYFGRAVLPQNLSAVTAACMMVRKSVFQELGGFDEQNFAVAYNDVDFCLRAREAGHMVVYTPYAELIHHESKSRGYEDTPEKQERFLREYESMLQRWGGVLSKDPYYNPNLSCRRADFSVSFEKESMSL